ncbi:hypothetical protein JD844_031973 [Phrynosoma platyrhinos]|uniref:Uncharacterized protein n=1 Tax=Phrynosoma platyrhinos TaxID=52577 RepID=A0ABQ7T4I3_PHRPL|nr:hypothetical protein JD844_031973 [Phrynosoma platyrhinos]
MLKGKEAGSLEGSRLSRSPRPRLVKGAGRGGGARPISVSHDPPRGSWLRMLRVAEFRSGEVLAAAQAHSYPKLWMAGGDVLIATSSLAEGDSDNYLAYYRRATVYLAMGKSKAAIRDLSKVVELKQDFTSARLQRGHLLLKQGKFDEAEEDFKRLLQSSQSDKEQAEARSQLMKSEEMQRLHSQAQSAYLEGDYYLAIGLLDEILNVCVWDAELRELRADCYIKEGEPGKAISDLKAAAKLKSDNTEAFYKISTIYYQLGDHEMSLSEVRECLKLDQDHKECFSHYKRVKKLNKQIVSAEDFIQEGR